jgi:hypothetical protein
VIVCPPGFYKSQHNGEWLLQPPDALKLLPLRYREKQKPLRTLRQLVTEIIAERTAQDPELTPLKAAIPATLTTAEGEFAATTTLLVRRGEQLGYIHIAAVFGDDSVSVIEAPVFEPSAVDSTALLLRQLAYTLPLGLGYRKRRYLYTPPLGWARAAHGLVTRFYPPDFPSHRAMLVVHPAVPRTVSPQALCSSLIERYRKKGLLFDSEGGATPIVSDHGLHGLAFCLATPMPTPSPLPPNASPGPTASSVRLLQDLLIFADAHYLYSLVFESTSEARRPELAQQLSALARSVQPLPPPQQPSQAKSSQAEPPASSIYL